MMKKNGFTLAEVLITLAIIGVVATMTLPALLTNTAEQQAKTGLKKGINTLTEAAQMTQANDGFDYASLASDDTENPEAQSLFAILTKRANIDPLKSGTKKLVIQKGTATETPDDNFVVFFRDGSALSFNPSETKSTVTNTDIQADGLPLGVAVVYDINGTKGPNILSNCNGAGLGAKRDTFMEDVAGCVGSKRVIKDQFGVKLRGGHAVPNGPAARWAFTN